MQEGRQELECMQRGNCVHEGRRYLCARRREIAVCAKKRDCVHEGRKDIKCMKEGDSCMHGERRMLELQKSPTANRLGIRAARRKGN